MKRIVEIKTTAPQKRINEFNLGKFDKNSLNSIFYELLESKKNEEKFKNFLYDSNVSLFEQDKNLRYLWVFNSYEIKNSNELIGKTDYELVEKDPLYNKVIKIKQKVLKTGKPAKEEFTFKNEKNTFFLDLIIKPKKERNRITGVITIATNITKLKKTQDELKKAESTIINSLTSSRMVSWEYLPSTDHIKFSNDFSEVFKLKIKKENKKFNEFIKLIEKDDAKIYEKRIKKALRKKESYVFLFRIKEDLRTDIKWIEDRGTVIKDERNRLKIIGIMSDITERKEIEEKKTQFMAVTTHELKSPITTIKAYTQILQRRLKDDKKNLYFLSHISYQTENITNLISELLDTSRIEANQLLLNKKLFSIEDLVKRIVVDFQFATDAHQILIEGGIQKEVYADRERIAQVLINLITNAIKYSPTKDRIIVKMWEEEKKAIVSVRDFGIGIPKLRQEKIFEPYFVGREKDFPTTIRSGLGLYITSQIIKKHKGKVWVKSEKGKGATFYFSLPIR